MPRERSPELLLAANEIVLQYPILATRIYSTAKGVSNDSFFVSSNKGEFVLRIYNTGTDIPGIRFEVGVLQKLHAAGVVVPGIVANKKKSQITQVKISGKTRYAILMKKLSGRIVEPTDHKLIPSIAKMHAKLHLAAQSSIKPRRSSAKTLYYTGLWLEQEVRGAKKSIGTSSAWGAYAKQVTTALAALRKNEKTIARLPAAECHLDYDSDNILTNGKAVTGVIDFGDIQNSPLIVDIGNSLCWWLFCNPRKYASEVLSKYLAAYAQARPLSQVEKSYLPLCIQIRNLGLAAYFYNHNLRSGDAYLKKVIQFNDFIDALTI